MSTHHRAAGSARRRALALLVAPLTIAATLVAAGPASADTKTFADGVGEATNMSPQSDITQYQVNLTATNLVVTVTTAAPLPSDRLVEVDVDVDADGAAEFSVQDDGAGTWSMLEFATNNYMLCPGAPVITTVNTVSFSEPTYCFGSPTHVEVAVAVWGWIGVSRYVEPNTWDVAPDQTLLFFSPQVTNGPDVAPTTTPQQVVYRFWSPTFNNAHFFTTNDAEAVHIYTSDTNWTYEGPAFSALAASGESCTGGSPVYRFYSPVFQSHFYTQNADEKAHIIATDKNWNYEGVAYCAYPTQQPGTTALYRFWSPGFGKHFFTANKDEADHIKVVDRNWNYEGIAYYVLPAGGPTKTPTTTRCGRVCQAGSR